MREHIGERHVHPELVPEVWPAFARRDLRIEGVDLDRRNGRTAAAGGWSL